jgi:Uma2 family endonuclease
MSIATSPLTSADFARIPDPGHPQELVRGVVVEMPPPGFRHGKICGRLTMLLTQFAEDQQIGHVLSNDSGIVTERQPDTVRGPDVYFVSYAKVSADAEVDYLTVAPDAVFEVRSPHDRSSELLAKVTEYLQLGVPTVYVLDPATHRVHCYYQVAPDEILSDGDEFVGQGLLAGFRVPLARLFAT